MPGVAATRNTLACGFMLLIGWLSGASAAGSDPASMLLPERPQLFFYPPALRLSDGSESGGIVTLNPRQITTEFPAIPQMSGVVLVVIWSSLCPQADHCDFSPIDQVLEFWGARGKKVILNVATVGPPVKVLDVGAPRFVSSTPEWVLDLVATYTAMTPTLGFIDGKNEAVARFPAYADPAFAELIERFVHGLARYDGHPVISQVRISTGRLGEDQPRLGPKAALRAIPGYTDLSWIAYCRSMTAIFRSTFKHTQLEFDLGRVGVSWAEGDEVVKRAADAFVEDLMAGKTFLQFNGLRDDTYENIGGDAQNAGIQHILYYLREARGRGTAVGLEAFAPMTDPRMQNVVSIVKAVRALRPKLLVLFPDSAALVYYENRGDQPSNAAEMKWINGHANKQAAASHVHELLHALGYE
jgi:hypothetical protein